MNGKDLISMVAIQYRIILSQDHQRFLKYDISFAILTGSDAYSITSVRGCYGMLYTPVLPGTVYHNGMPIAMKCRQRQHQTCNQTAI
jgi:hypothetical protein